MASTSTRGCNMSGMYSLKWNNFQTHLASGIRQLLEKDEFTDVILACEGQFVRAHKFLLSLCSPFFKKLFQVNYLKMQFKTNIEEN